MPSNKLKEFFLAVLITVVFTLLTLLPAAALSILCAAAVTALLGYSATRFHYGFVAFQAFVICAVYVLFQKSLSGALITSLPVILCGLTLGICYNVKLSVFKLLSIFTSVYVLNIAVNIKLAGMASTGQNIFEEAIASVGQVYKESLTAMYGSQLSGTEINNVVSELTSTLLRFTPSFIVIACICFALLSYYLFKRILKIRKSDLSMFASFSEWRADKVISITYFVLLALYFVVPAGNFLSDTLLNMVTVMTFVFFVLGLSFLEYKLKNRIEKSGVRKLVLVGISLSAFVLMGLPFLALAICGALDGCFDFRHRKKIIR